MMTDAERDAAIAIARTYIGVRFGHRGRSHHRIDCIGLLVRAYGDAGRYVPDRLDYRRNPVRDGLRQELIDRFGQPLQPEAMQAGDVALMRWHQPQGVKLFNHVGIITPYPLGGFGLIHASAQEKRVVEHRIAGPWPRRIVEVYRP